MDCSSRVVSNSASELYESREDVPWVVSVDLPRREPHNAKSFCHGTIPLRVLVYRITLQNPDNILMSTTTKAVVILHGLPANCPSRMIAVGRVNKT